MEFLSDNNGSMCIYTIPHRPYGFLPIDARHYVHHTNVYRHYVTPHLYATTNIQPNLKSIRVVVFTPRQRRHGPTIS